MFLAKMCEKSSHQFESSLELSDGKLRLMYIIGTLTSVPTIEMLSSHCFSVSGICCANITNHGDWSDLCH